ncbi:divergent polysaccharide deacetylase family protein [Sulfitobacter sp. S190]|uniref:divergent polysaccharide deacetylase family protein n=1 Tax=Sulfitobacter sp. S190 TaxID=2867022 RepID=UPI0021A2EA8B|nr:polysaccharide deacteylase family 2 protein [Sulfitobacter sp. S190]UWR23768.1 divergent polysaccharide deacetylase family protein [Sulfitobacter sp. S190]
MIRGLLGGIGLGAVFSVGVASVASLVLPIGPTAPVAPAPDTSVPAARVDGVPADVAQRPATDPVAEPEAPEAPEAQPAPAAEQPPAEPVAPQEPVPDRVAQQAEPDPVVIEAPQPAQAPDAPAPDVADDAPVQAAGDAPATAPVDAPQTYAAAAPQQPVPTPPQRAQAGDGVPQVPTALQQPQTAVVADPSRPQPLPQDQTAALQPDAPVLPNPQALAPMIPDDGSDSAVATEPAAPLPAPAPQVDPVEEAALPPAPETPIAPAVPETAPDVAPEPSPDADPQPPAVRVLPAPNTAQTAPDAAALPRIGRPATRLIDGTGSATAPQPETIDTPVDPADLPPLEAFAADFENLDAKPLMSLVLIDTGADLDGGEIGLPALRSFPYPISFAVDSSLADAAARMQRYRDDGFEVLAMIDLPEGAQPNDAEVNLNATLSSLSQVVGVLEGTEGGLQPSRETADQVSAILRSSGHGLVTRNQGLNTMANLARKQGVAAAPIFRDFDSNDQNARVIRRFLDQAAFKAGQEGGVIMLGRLRPETIKALLVWALADRAGTVALAPVSAVLTAQ